MPVFAIGDVQGCHAELCDLLELTGFDASTDRLWFVGDLVNRGPDSLEVLRAVRALGDAAVVVLGNHDLHLLATVAGARRPRRKDTFDAVLAASDRDALVDWLRTRPLVHHDPAVGYGMVHAGLPPQWTLDEALARAAELESILRGSRWREFMRHMYGDRPERWSNRLTGWDRLRYITNGLTRMRYCRKDGALNMKEDGPPGTQPAGLIPWYAVPGRASRDARIVFGHWATLALVGDVDPVWNVWHLDTGCVWGGSLSALRLDDGRRFSVPGRARPRR